jgi:transcriptional regulator with XRE-family HTH domain
MQESQLIIEELKTVLKARGITYLDLSEKLEVSESTIKRTLTSQKITLQRLEQICVAASISLFELTSLIKKPEKETKHTYSLKQERFLAKNPKYLAFFDLLIRHGSLTKVKKIRPQLKPKNINMYLNKLDELGLIEWHPGDKVKFPVGRDVAWIPNGPLRNTFLKWAKDDFVSDDFKREHDHFSFSVAELTEASIEKIQQRLKEVAGEVSHLARVDKNTRSKTENFAVMLGSRPWTFSILEDC